MKKALAWGLLALSGAAWVFSVNPSLAKEPSAKAIKGVVEDASGQKVSNATVWLIR